jgi:hypothetical protein
MAKKQKEVAAKAEPAPAAEVESQSAQSAEINVALLRQIEAQTIAKSYLFVTDADAQPLVAAGYIERNPSMVDPATGAQAARILDNGVKFLKENTVQSTDQSAVAETQLTAQAEAKPAKAAKPKKQFVIAENVPVPDARPRGGKREEAYPFSKLEINQSFFIAATEENPKPEITYAGTVGAARNRFSTVHPTETKTNRKGETVPVLVPTRDFVIRGDIDGAPYGQPGVRGAGIFRVK